MKLYRAHYAPRDGALRPRRITFAAADATDAHRIAGWFESADETLLTVKMLRPLAWQLDLDVGNAN